MTSKISSTLNKMKKKNKFKLPLYCDYSCPYAEYGEEEVAGGCWREIAVYCTILNDYNNKNNLCLVTIREKNGKTKSKQYSS